MKLNDFLKAEDISMGAFAKTVGTTTATISPADDGVVVPRKALMERIHEANPLPSHLGEVTRQFALQQLAQPLPRSMSS